MMRECLAEIAENAEIVFGRSILFPRIPCFPRAKYLGKRGRKEPQTSRRNRRKRRNHFEWSILFLRIPCFPRALFPSFCHKLTNSPHHWSGGKNGLAAVLPLLVKFAGSGFGQMNENGRTGIKGFVCFNPARAQISKKENEAIRRTIEIKLED